MTWSHKFFAPLSISHRDCNLFSCGESIRSRRVSASGALSVPRLLLCDWDIHPLVASRVIHGRFGGGMCAVSPRQPNHSWPVDALLVNIVSSHAKQTAESKLAIDRVKSCQHWSCFREINDQAIAFFASTLEDCLPEHLLSELSFLPDNRRCSRQNEWHWQSN